MISFTEKAIEVMKEATQEGGMIRVAVKGGGCSGFIYDVKVENNPQESDIIIDFEEDDLKICIDPQSSFMLEDTIVNYETTLASSGFKFVNPKASQSCGCGKSFG
jgi:iron-sulfur cluster assembly protein